MSTKVTFSLLISLILTINCYSQLGPNLIENWSFEQIQPDANGETICFSCNGCIYNAEFWKSAYGSVHYFNECSNGEWPDYGVPNNIYGTQDAKTGNAYALLGGYINYPNLEDFREYLWMELEDSLKQGHGYYWEAHVSLADSMNFALSQLGVLFSHENTRLWQQNDFFDVIPQIQNPKDSLLDSKDDWMKVSGQFVANGGEKYMTIGFFNRDTAENIVRVSNYPYITTLWEQSAYYIDDVVLKEDNSIGIREPEKYTIELYPNPASDQVTLGYEPSNARSMQWQVADMTGRVLHQQQLRSNERRASLGINLPSGIYLSTVIADGVAVSSLRLIVL